MSSLLSQKHLQNEDAAYAWVERHVWPDGPTCPKCGEKERVSKLKGKSTRKGTYKCYVCRKPFTVKVGTIFEDSKVKMHLWLQAFYLICGSKKGISSNQLHRTLGVTLKTAWFMDHRIREAMRHGSLAPPLGGGEGGVVESDETYLGNNKDFKHFKRLRGYQHKHTILTLVDRDGEARSFHVDRTDAVSILPIIKANIAKEATVVTDTAGHYRSLKKERGDKHQAVNHRAGEYARGPIYTNTVEGYFSIFKRGMRGVYQHCSEKHLHRYLAEYDFRYSNRIARGIDDDKRTVSAVKGVVGKRLTYR